jgi:hypothetical protein
MDARTTTCLFEEDYWLEAAAPGEWQAVEVRRDDGELIGRLPYAVRKRWGQPWMIKPWYTIWMGPWVRPGEGKYCTEISHQHQVLHELLAGLPRTALNQVCCSPEIGNMMAFHWAGYRLSLGYTHRLDTAEPDRIWADMRDPVRRQIRKAEKQVRVHDQGTLGNLMSMIEKSFARQDLNVSQSFPVLERIDAMMGERGQRRIWVAEDAQGRVHAAIYIVFDSRHAFYLAGGGDPALRQSGAQSLVMWQAIQAAREQAPVFDFAGSMVEGIEHFVRGFGARQVPRYVAERATGWGRLHRAYLGLRGH